VKFSSPKNHVHPEGVFNDASVNEIASGTVPVVGMAVKSATGFGCVVRFVNGKLSIFPAARV
jgi:hypothetical protein